MPKICDYCRQFAHDADTVCPSCSAPLRFTFFQPEADPAPVAPRSFGAKPATRDRRPVFSLSTASPLGFVVLTLAAAVLYGAVWEWSAHGPTGGSDSAGRVRVGMAMSDVARVIEPESRQAGIPHLTDDFPPGNTRSGDLVWREDGRWVRVTFAGGYVTGVREEEAGLSGFGNTGRRVQMRLD